MIFNRCGEVRLCGSWHSVVGFGWAGMEWFGSTRFGSLGLGTAGEIRCGGFGWGKLRSGLAGKVRQCLTWLGMLRSVEVGCGR